MESNQPAAPATSTTTPNDAAAAAATGMTNALGQVTQFIERMSEVATAENSIGPVQEHAGHTVVPVASVAVQAGFGLGFGGGGGGDSSGQGQGSGGGGGGGGQATARTIAVVDVSESGVCVKPVLDWTRIGLAAMALIGIRMLSGLGNRRARQNVIAAIRRP